MDVFLVRLYLLVACVCPVMFMIIFGKLTSEGRRECKGESGDGWLQMARRYVSMRVLLL